VPFRQGTIYSLRDKRSRMFNAVLYVAPTFHSDERYESFIPPISLLLRLCRLYPYYGFREHGSRSDTVHRLKSTVIRPVQKQPVSIFVIV